MNCQSHWLDCISSFTAPIIALLSAGFGSLIAYRQWRTARNKLLLDLFDRRFAIYISVVDLLTRQLTAGQLDDKYIYDYFVAIRPAKWLFCREVAMHLENDIGGKVRELRDLVAEGAEIQDPNERAKNISAQRDLKNTIDSHLRDIDNVFRPFLSIYNI